MQRIHFNEVVTRGGFQNEPAFVPTDAKVALIDALSACGYAKVEVTSFTSAKAIPMLHAMRFETGVDLPQLLAVARRLPEIVGHDVPGQVAKAGLTTDLHPAPSCVAELRSQCS